MVNNCQPFQSLLSAPTTAKLELVRPFLGNSHAKVLSLVAQLLLDERGGIVVGVAVVASVVVRRWGRHPWMGSRLAIIASS